MPFDDQKLRHAYGQTDILYKHVFRNFRYLKLIIPLKPGVQKNFDCNIFIFNKAESKNGNTDRRKVKI